MSFQPNQEQVMSLLRNALAIAGTSLAVFGYGQYSEQWAGIAGLIMMVAPVIWGLFTHTEANAVAVAAAIPAVEKVEVKRTSAGVALKKAAGSSPEAQVVFVPSP